MPLQLLKSFWHKDHFVIMERNTVNGSIAVNAGGGNLKHVFYDFSLCEVVRQTKTAITNGGF